MAKLIAGLKPRGFTWVIADRLAVSERIGGNGFQHRKVRREEEITWLTEEAGVTSVVSLLTANQNVSAYTEAGLSSQAISVAGPITRGDCERIYSALDARLADPGTKVLVHREVIDDDMAGLLGGYLLHSGLITDPVLAVAVIQEILSRPLGPRARALITPVA